MMDDLERWWWLRDTFGAIINVPKMHKVTECHNGACRQVWTHFLREIGFFTPTFHPSADGTRPIGYAHAAPAGLLAGFWTTRN